MQHLWKTTRYSINNAVVLKSLTREIKPLIDWLTFTMTCFRMWVSVHYIYQSIMLFSIRHHHFAIFLCQYWHDRCLALLVNFYFSSPGSTNVPRSQFTDPEVQDILTKITGLDLQKVFRPLKQQRKPPKYKLMTDAELDEVSVTLSNMV